ncbi:Cobalt-dependent inorganic pyrophosphatase [Rubrobacter xylanophilus DSM 9941]|uniref:putative manganese-dependent inorganic diphosphatase n=1 Tax=Rubrobacter xylanophilus TaxID=49319 RepID=UPI001C63C710|nr:putative manganese-dependent inorganic diphosphatase [Rubrobacter xylanophilus]QYJ17027.1 Cobalt-dependent inorganic pyrophosphatase [Rubrobacter xylanophilus DSM 9941]
MAHVYVTGHKNPDTDTIASAIAYAEFKNRVDPDNVYAPARLGEPNSQTRWALKKSGAEPPKLLRHIMLRVKDVMNKNLIVANRNDPLHSVGLAMAKNNIGQIPIVDDDGTLVGIITERDLARMYIRESRDPSTFAHTPVSVGSIVEVLEGELLAGEDRETSGKLWVISMSVDSMGRQMEPGDIVVIGDRTDAQLRAIELGAGILVVSNGVRPDGEVLRLAGEKGTSVVLSPLDSYVTSRMIQLSVPCWEVMSENPLTVHPDDLISDITQQVMEVHYRAAIAVDEDKVPKGIVSRTDLVNPEPRKVLLVDHAEVGQSVEGVERAQIVEILDHHHIGDIETPTPIPATFDPVGSTATLIVERFRERGLEPERSTAMMLLAAVLSDTVILNSPTTTERDHEVVRYLEGLLGLDAREFGMEMFEASSDVSGLSAEEIVTRDAKEYGTSGGDRLCIAQVETVGRGLLERREELLEALERMRREKNYVVAALMVTDIMERGTELLCVGDRSIVERAFGGRVENNGLHLPGVMSRKKQVAPKILAVA